MNRNSVFVDIRVTGYARPCAGGRNRTKTKSLPPGKRSLNYNKQNIYLWSEASSVAISGVRLCRFLNVFHKYCHSPENDNRPPFVIFKYPVTNIFAMMSNFPLISISPVTETVPLPSPVYVMLPKNIIQCYRLASGYQKIHNIKYALS